VTQEETQNEDDDDNETILEADDYPVVADSDEPF